MKPDVVWLSRYALLTKLGPKFVFALRYLLIVLQQCLTSFQNGLAFGLPLWSKLNTRKPIFFLTDYTFQGQLLEVLREIGQAGYQ